MAQREVGRARIDRAVGSSVRGNSTAFGFSIMITLSFGMLGHLRGSPDVVEMFLFGVSAAVAVSILEAAVTRGFVAQIRQVSQRVDMLGTALNFASVAAGVGAALAVGEVIGGVWAWPISAFAAATTYVLTESAEIFAAERIHGEDAADAAEAQEPG